MADAATGGAPETRSPGAWTQRDNSLEGKLARVAMRRENAERSAPKSIIRNLEIRKGARQRHR